MRLEKYWKILSMVFLIIALSEEYFSFYITVIFAIIIYFDDEIYRFLKKIISKKT